MPPLWSDYQSYAEYSTTPKSIYWFIKTDCPKPLFHYLCRNIVPTYYLHTKQQFSSCKFHLPADHIQHTLIPFYFTDRPITTIFKLRTSSSSSCGSELTSWVFYSNQITKRTVIATWSYYFRIKYGHTDGLYWHYWY